MSSKEQENDTEKIINTTPTTLYEEEIDFSIVDALPPQHTSKPEQDNDEVEDQYDKVDEKSSSKIKKSKKKKDKKSSTESNTIPMSQLFRFATPLDKFYMIVGAIAAIANGVSVPFMTIIFSGFIDIFGRFSLAISTHNSTGDEEKFDEAKRALDTNIRTYVIYFVILGAAMFLASYIQMTLWTIAGENQAKVSTNFCAKLCIYYFKFNLIPSLLLIIKEGSQIILFIDIETRNSLF